MQDGVSLAFQIIDIFPQFLEITHKPNTEKVLKSGNKKVECLRILGLQEWHAGEFSGFSYFMHPGWGSLETFNRESPITSDKEN